jgi:hypothetical protein
MGRLLLVISLFMLAEFDICSSVHTQIVAAFIAVRCEFLFSSLCLYGIQNYSLSAQTVYKVL